MNATACDPPLRHQVVRSIVPPRRFAIRHWTKFSGFASLAAMTKIQRKLPHRGRAPASRVIAVAAYKGVSLLDLAGPLEAFRVASVCGAQADRRVAYECVVVSMLGGPVMTADGVEPVTKSTRSLSKTPIDTLIVPGAFAVDDVTGDRGLVQWVRRRAPTCRR